MCKDNNGAQISLYVNENDKYQQLKNKISNLDLTDNLLKDQNYEN